MKKFGDDPSQNDAFDTWYNGATNSCVDFVYKALEIGKIDNYPGDEGHPVTMINIPRIEYLLNNHLYFFHFYKEFSVLDSFNTAQSTASPPPRRDPLIFDLDGDGIETVASTGGAYFDHDGNGFAERTGWVSGDDGLLVRDINGDGMINNGRELFGDRTLKKRRR
jgi:hypothetical protein